MATLVGGNQKTTKQMNNINAKTYLITLLTVLLVASSGKNLAIAADSVQILDDGGSGFSLVNPTHWYRTDFLGFGDDYRSGVGTGTATWTFSVNPGSYRVSITWHNPGSPYNLAN